MDENLPINNRNQPGKSLHRGIRLRMMIAIPALIVLTPLIPIALFQFFNVDLIQILLNASKRKFDRGDFGRRTACRHCGGPGGGPNDSGVR